MMVTNYQRGYTFERLIAADLPVIASKPLRGVTYRLLTGPGPRDHTPWTPDPLGDTAA